MSANTRLVIAAILMATLSISVILSAPTVAMPINQPLEYPQGFGH